MDISAMFKSAEPRAAAFHDLLRQKPDRTDSRADRFRSLQVQAATLAEQAKRGHHLQTMGTLIFLEGVALGLDAVTDQEIADINKIQ